jgi:CRISPR-associated protein Cmr5
MHTRDQIYAKDAYDHVKEVQRWKEAERNRYGALAHKLPVLIRTAGLAQALTFLDAKAKDEQEKQGQQSPNAYRQLLTDLAKTMKKDTKDALLERAREAELTEYMLLTRQALAALLWYKRFAQSLLDVTDAQAAGD